MPDREDFERRARQVFREFNDDADQVFDSDEWARRMLDALGLTVETVWDDGGDPGVWLKIRPFELGEELYLYHSDHPATDDDLRSIGLVKKRRLVSEWEEVDG